MDRKNAWTTYSKEELDRLEQVNTEYKNCLDAGKTERECVTLAVEKAKAEGYKDIRDIIKNGEKVKAGDKLYAVCMNKTIALFHMGTKPLTEGMNILGAHIDSPRIDVKQNPLYENEEFAYLDTHYYGGIKKYQWVTLPLALHGVIAKKDGTTVQVSIGEKEDDPVFCITDLLPHLAAKQNERPLREGLKGEELNVVLGSLPYEGEDIKDAVKLSILALLHEQYGMKEKDFFRAEFELVPAVKARDIGLDRSLVGAYGQDDRVCAYTALTAEIDTKKPEHTTVTILTDKEETGSDGNTGLNSDYVLHVFLLKKLSKSGITSCFKSAPRSMGDNPLLQIFVRPCFPTLPEQNLPFQNHESHMPKEAMLLIPQKMLLMDR